MIDVEKIRKDFPMYRNSSLYNGKPFHYLDNAATTFKPYDVIKACDHYYMDITANTSRGDYALAHDADVAYNEARSTVAKFLNAEYDEVIFTSGDTMALNEIAYGLIDEIKEGDEILLSLAEHASNVLPWFKIAKLKKAVIKYIPLDEKGKITVENFTKTISNKTKIVSLAAVTNVLGYLLPVKELCAITHANNAIFILDGAQSVPHYKTDVKDIDCDFLAFSGHKMVGPTGIGVLYGKRKMLNLLSPLFMGGEMNARFYSDQTYTLKNAPERFEAGTCNIAGALGLAKACEYLEKIGFDEIVEHEKRLKIKAVEGLNRNGNCIIYNPDLEGGIITFNVKGVFAQDTASYLDNKGVFIRSGTHCAKMLPEFLKEDATCRASLYFYNDEKDVDALVEACKHAEDFLDVFFN